MASVEEKTESATPKRLREARSKGNVAKSQDFNTAMILLFGMLIVYYLGGSMLSCMKDIMVSQLGNIFYETFDTASLQTLIIDISSKNVKGTLPVLGGIMIIGLISSFTQVGVNFSPKALIPNFKKFNPITGIKNLVSKRSLVKLAMSLVKISIMGGVAYFSIRKDLDPLMELVSMRVEGIFHSASSLIFAMTLKITIILLILSLLDFLYQRWQHAKDQKMTKTEVKQESKQSEGDPLIKSRIKSAQREMSNKRMMNAIPEADVVVTNPTHYAVALKYKAETMNAPTVIAKGVDYLALKIIEIAKKSGVPTVEDKILARMLYSTVEIDQEIPPKLFQAVAKVLSYVYQLRNMIGR
ncbi:MAG: flagellar biosynthesis protein FlhB [Candidatus Scalindua sp. AMX11]|nr:MAG: flagellar biosynthesis protein FlhB [Candidatus Scalindua sp.]NOG85788.1 flagellar biosynthesis protein FlhB [Planctomycetota bacterium]RZV97036.1 MAG: flagellar biosynthesis protein FlhB [Candidatus Scalindua sp. SCAELEC01]TDE66350.1 MAG: flagellar biosynthesis protein FlhB [Candidatus Scalindua sp. AMX11]GJQ58258.1 MAG: flagellar biosynthetic protein FlhB [Candidatus Scalindua sp.]